MSNPSFRRTLLSALQAIIGVHSQQQSEEDFSEKNATAVIVTGIVIAIILVLTIVMIVHSVVP